MGRSKIILGLLFSAASLLPACRAEEVKPAEVAPVPAETPAPPAPPAPTPETNPGPVTPVAPATVEPKKTDAAVVAPPPAPPVAPANSGGEVVDMIGDKPEAVAAAKPKPLMDDMTPDGPVNRRATSCYHLLAEMKTHMEQISKDLDNNGKEVTRLIKTSDALAKDITLLANLWPEDDLFRDVCGTVKRDALNLNTELSQSPRVWSHVRWAYNDTLKDVRKVRMAAKSMADAEPKPIEQVGKDGKIVYVDAPNNVNPAIAKRDMRKAEAEAMSERARKIEDLKRNPPLETDMPKSEP